MLDPAVRLEDLPAPKPSVPSMEPAVPRGSLLVHEALEAAAVLPGGAGLREFVEALR